MLLPPDQPMVDVVANIRYESEDDCRRALEEIEVKLGGGAFQLPEERDPYDVLGAAESWAGLMSYPVIRTYAPQSPMRFATWSQNVPATLWRAAQPLRAPLAWVAQTIGAADFAIGVNFPWGVTVSLTWT